MHGVTGSGKTEVYIQAIDEVIRFGRQAIVLVPEISLTPQTEARFRSPFRQRGRVAQPPARRRTAAPLGADRRAGEVSVVVGARSAIFAPVPNLGLIVWTKSTNRRSSRRRRRAIMPATWRCAADDGRERAAGAGLGHAVAGKLAAGQDGRVSADSLPRRVFDRPLPAVGTIDLRTEFQDRRNRGAVSRQLRLAMADTLKEGGQIILLLNRRGFSTHIQCPSCGMVLECPHCAIALTHHATGQVALCHYCDYQMAAPTECPGVPLHAAFTTGAWARSGSKPK